MDQFASVTGGVILYDAAKLKATAIHPNLGPYVFAVADSGVDRSLAESSYGIRVRESHAILDQARHALKHDLPNLAALTHDDLDTLRQQGDLPSHLLKRATHVVTEVARVGEGLSALEHADWVRFGELMTASGRSSALDYEISHPRVEALVTEARAVDGVLGARMMGGGEGGSALILLRRDALQPLESHLRANYYAAHGMSNRPHLVYAFQFADGARVGEVNGELHS
jgi:galactokinase